jgi:hypothetical protein
MELVVRSTVLKTGTVRICLASWCQLNSYASWSPRNELQDANENIVTSLLPHIYPSSSNEINNTALSTCPAMSKLERSEAASGKVKQLHVFQIFIFWRSHRCINEVQFWNSKKIILENETNINTKLLFGIDFNTVLYFFFFARRS